MLENYIAFIGSSFIIILTPGPDIIFSVTQGLAYGKKAGLTTALGLACGNIVHTFLAILGIAVILKTNAMAFNLLKYLGIIYLVFLGIQSNRHKGDTLKLKSSENKSKNLFLRGFIMNIINPKVAIFFIAFFPQFVVPKLGNITQQMFILGGIFILLVILIFGTLSYYASLVGTTLKHKPALAKYVNMSATIIFFALAFKLFFTQRL